MSDRCDRCGRMMEPQDFEANYISVNIGFSGTHDGITYFGDSWTLLCNDCATKFMEGWREFKNGAPWKECVR